MLSGKRVENIIKQKTSLWKKGPVSNFSEINDQNLDVFWIVYVYLNIALTLGSLKAMEY